MSEPLYRGKSLPFAIFSVIHFQIQLLIRIIRPSPKNNHTAIHKYCSVLIPSLRLVHVHLVRCLHPIPLAISMFPQTPSVIQRALILPSSTKNNYHAIGVSLGAKHCCMIGSWFRRGWTINLLPLKRVFFYIKNPNITNSFRACISSKNDQIGSAVGN